MMASVDRFLIKRSVSLQLYSAKLSQSLATCEKTVNNDKKCDIEVGHPFGHLHFHRFANTKKLSKQAEGWLYSLFEQPHHAEETIGVSNSKRVGSEHQNLNCHDGS